MLRFLNTPFTQGRRHTVSGHTMLFVLLLLAGLLLAAPAMASDPIGSVATVTGECRITRGSETLIAEQDLPIQLKDQVSTGPGAELSILFVDETRLSLSESSQASIDRYVYSDEASDLLFKFTKGTFRTITGGIVKQNPEGFNMETPLASIGIRGSDIYAIVSPDGEETGALHLGETHYVEVKTDKQTVNITESGMRVKISPTGVIFTPTRIPASMFNTMLNIGPGAQAPAGGAPTSGATKSLKTPTSKTSTKSLRSPKSTPKSLSTPKTSPKTLEAPKTAPKTLRTPTMKTTTTPTSQAPTMSTTPTVQPNVQMRTPTAVTPTTPTVQPTVKTTVKPKVRLF